MSKPPGYLSKMFDGLSEDKEIADLDMHACIKEHSSDIKNDKPVSGRVTRISGGKVWVDVGLKSEGSIDLTEFRNDGSLDVGSEVEVWVKSREGGLGIVVLSREIAVRYGIWNQLLELHKNSEAVPGKILFEDKPNSGFVIDILGINAFLPHAHVGATASGERIVGNEEKFTILKIDNEEDFVNAKIYVSRKSTMLDSEQIEAIEGGVFTGKVDSVLDAGATVSFSINSTKTLTGWLSLGNIGKLADSAKEVLKEGDECEVSVLKIHDSGKIQLTMNHVVWEKAKDNFKKGMMCNVEVVNVVKEGVIVLLPNKDSDGNPLLDGSAVLRGLISHNDTCGIRGKALEKFFKKGKKVEAIIKELNNADMSVQLTIRGTSFDPWKELTTDPGYVFDSYVRHVLHNDKIFVAMSDWIDGLVKLNMYQLWQMPKVSDKIRATVIECDVDKGRVLLAYGEQDIAKQNQLISELSQGAQITVKVQHVISSGSDIHGLYTLYQDHLHGFIRERYIAYGKSLSDYKPGDKVSVIVESIGLDHRESNPEDRFVMLSALAAEKRIRRESRPMRRATFGDMTSEGGDKKK